MDSLTVMSLKGLSDLPVCISTGKLEVEVHVEVNVQKTLTCPVKFREMELF